MEMSVHPCQAPPMRRLVFIALVLGSVTCQEAPPKARPAGPPAPAKPPEVLVGGCDAWFANNVCESNGPLKVWVEGDKPTEVRLPGWTVSEPTEVRGGFRVTLQPGPVGARGALTYGPRNIQITDVTTTTTTPVLDALLEKMSTDDLLELAPTLALDGRAIVLDRVRRDVHKRGGIVSTERALDWLIATNNAISNTMGESRFRALAARAKSKLHQFAAARTYIEQAPTKHHADARSSAFFKYYHALLVRDSGSPTRSVQYLFVAEEIAARTNQGDFQRAATQLVLPELHRVGLGHLGADLERGLLNDAKRLECESEGAIYTNVGWSRLRARESEINLLPSGSPAIPSTPSSLETTVLLEAAYDLAIRCDGNIYNSLLNLAYNSLQLGATDQAREWLTAADDQVRDPEHRVFHSLLRAKLDQAENLPREARANYSRLLESGSLNAVEKWEATAGLAKSYIGNNDEKALELLERAEHLATGIENQASLLSNQRDDAAATLGSTRVLVDLLASRKRFSEAWTIARTARRRLAAVRTSAVRLANIPAARRTEADAARAIYLEARQELDRLRSELWQLASEDEPSGLSRIARQERRVTKALKGLLRLANDTSGSANFREPGSMQAFILLFPGQYSWWVFARTAKGTAATQLETGSQTPDVAALGRAFEKVLPPLELLSEVQFFPTGLISSIDLHTAPVHGRAIGLQIPVAYAVDAAHTIEPGANRTHAVLLGDPAPHLDTDSELQEIAADLRAQGIGVKTPGPQRRTIKALHDSLRKADIFHFSGHAEAHTGPFASRLRIGASRWLTAADVISAPRAGRHVVLAGCETGVTSGGKPGWTIAEAFIVSGAQEVLASHRRIELTMARFVGSAAHASQAPLSHQLQFAVRALEQKQPELDWSAFRVLVR